MICLFLLLSLCCSQATPLAEATPTPDTPTSVKDAAVLTCSHTHTHTDIRDSVNIAVPPCRRSFILWLTAGVYAACAVSAALFLEEGLISESQYVSNKLLVLTWNLNADEMSAVMCCDCGESTGAPSAVLWLHLLPVLYKTALKPFCLVILS